MIIISTYHPGENVIDYPYGAVLLHPPSTSLAPVTQCAPLFHFKYNKCINKYEQQRECAAKLFASPPLLIFLPRARAPARDTRGYALFINVFASVRTEINVERVNDSESVYEWCAPSCTRKIVIVFFVYGHVTSSKVPVSFDICCCLPRDLFLNRR